MTDEIWKAVHGHETYEVSSLGRMRHNGKMILTGPYVFKGYRSLGLHFGKRRSVRRYVHTLVAEAFIGRRPLGKQIAHLDGDRRNNAASNLAYVTPEENAAHKKLHGTENIGSRNGSARLTDDLVFAIRLYPKTARSASRLAEVFGVSYNTIRRAQTGVTWGHVKDV